MLNPGETVIERLESTETQVKLLGNVLKEFCSYYSKAHDTVLSNKDMLDDNRNLLLCEYSSKGFVTNFLYDEFKKRFPEIIKN